MHLREHDSKALFRRGQDPALLSNASDGSVTQSTCFVRFAELFPVLVLLRCTRAGVFFETSIRQLPAASPARARRMGSSSRMFGFEPASLHARGRRPRHPHVATLVSVSRTPMCTTQFTNHCTEQPHPKTRARQHTYIFLSLSPGHTNRLSASRILLCTGRSPINSGENSRGTPESTHIRVRD